VRGAVRARRRTNRLAFVLGAIVVAFVLAFFSLAQSVRVSATGYDVERLQAQRDALLTRKQELLTDLNRLGQEPAIRKLAIDARPTQRPAPLVVAARCRHRRPPHGPARFPPARARPADRLRDGRLGPAGPPRLLAGRRAAAARGPGVPADLDHRD